MSRSSRLVALAALALALPVVGCSGGDEVTDADVVEELSTDLETTMGLSASDADCVAERLVDDLGADELRDVDFAADEPPASDQEELAAAVLDARSDCDVDLSTTGR
jgi:hypothetical protein